MGFLGKLLGGISGERKAEEGARRSAEFAKKADVRLQPFSQFGQTYGIGGVTDLLDPSTPYAPSSPSYQFRFGEGQRALEQGAAAKGKLHSGQLMKRLVEFGSDFASQEYEKDFQRRFQIAQLGAGAAAGQAQAFSAAGGQAVQAYGQAGQLRGQAFGEIMGLAGTAVGAMV